MSSNAVMKRQTGLLSCSGLRQFHQFFLGFSVASIMAFLASMNNVPRQTEHLSPAQGITPPLVTSPIDAKRCCGPYCRVILAPAAAHYDEKYFEWQNDFGRKKARTKDWNAFLETRTSHTVADLGAGGAHILATLNVSRRIAVEINQVAWNGMDKLYPNMIEKYKYPEDIPDDILDIVYSVSAIEHFECPLAELREMARKVKIGGKIVLGIKNEGAAFGRGLITNDKDHHLYTWSHQQLFNLITSAGFHVDGISPHVSQVMEYQTSHFRDPKHFKSEDAKIYLWIRGTKKKKVN